jgi:hypothetical protein
MKRHRLPVRLLLTSSIVLFPKMVGHHRSRRGGAAINAVRVSGLQLCTINVYCYILTSSTYDYSLNSDK